MKNDVRRNKDTGTALERYFKSFKHAVDGIVYAIEYEHNMLIIMVAAILVMILSIILPISMMELIIIVILVALVMAAEFINTAIEATIDLVSTKEHPLAKIAKDTASSATLVLSAASLICGIVIFLPKILDLFK